MEPNILVTWATRAGSAAGVAEHIGNILTETGAHVDVLPLREAGSPEKYTAVVIGSGIRAGRMYGEVLSFVRDNRESLSRIPVACFVTCLTMKDDTPEHRVTANAFLDPIRQHIQPVDVGLFGGVVDFSKLGMVVRVIFKNMAKVSEGDYRDWNAIEAWARKIAPKLMG